MKAFEKDKCPGPDGWTIEFFIHFFDIIKLDLLRIVEATRISGSIHHITSSTQIAVIPKKLEAYTFKDFRPIFLCNITFKIITKIIVERIKATLAVSLSKDQHAFLKGRNIMDAVTNTQESLFPMLSNRSEAAILKIDFQRDYDCLDWGFIRCLLEKISLKSNVINWIMACIENVNYAVIINGIPSPFFPAERGLRQGFPLLPLLFILAMNSLSLHINKAISENTCKPVNISRNNYVSHNLFVDDVLIFAMLCKITWRCINDILCRFQRATGLLINKSKSILYHKDTNMELVEWISELFGVGIRSIKDGVKYLGFHLKAKSYSKDDWKWLIDRYYKKISAWEYKCFSGWKNCPNSCSTFTTCCILGPHFLPPGKHHSENEQDHCKFYLGRQFCSRKISSRLYGEDFQTKAFKWLGSIGFEDLREGTSVQILVEGHLRGRALEPYH